MYEVFTTYDLIMNHLEIIYKGSFIKWYQSRLGWLKNGLNHVKSYRSVTQQDPEAVSNERKSTQSEEFGRSSEWGPTLKRVCLWSNCDDKVKTCAALKKFNEGLKQNTDCIWNGWWEHSVTGQDVQADLNLCFFCSL